MISGTSRSTLASALLLSIGVALSACGERTDPQYRTEIDSWHAERIARLTQEDSWLSLVGLHPLPAGHNRIGSAAGSDVQLTAAAPAELGVVTVTGAGITLSVADGVTV